MSAQDFCNRGPMFLVTILVFSSQVILAMSLNEHIAADQIDGILRYRRQVSGQQQQQSAGLPDVQNAFKMFTSVFSSPAQASPISEALQNPLAAIGQQPQQQPAMATATQLMGQLSELVRSTQDRSAKMAASAQQNAQQAGQQTMAAAQSAQTGVQAALTEIGQGLQKIAMNNPSLLPDVKNLYSSVSSKLAPSPVASQSDTIVPAKNAEQLADNIAKVALGAGQNQ